MVAAPLAVPPWAWQRDDLRGALERRDIAAVLRAVQKYSGASQSTIAAATGMLQGRVSEVLRGTRMIIALDVLERVADGLQMPDGSRMALGLAPCRTPDSTPSLSADGLTALYGSQSQAVVDIRAATTTAALVDVLAVRGLGIFGMSDSLLRRSLPAGATLRVLLLDPDSDAARRRAAEIEEDCDGFAAGVRFATTQLAQLGSSREDLTVECFYYDTMPTWRIIAPEPTMFVSSFGAELEGHRSTMYRLEPSGRGSGLYLGFRRFLEEHRRAAHRVL